MFAPINLYYKDSDMVNRYIMFFFRPVFLILITVFVSKEKVKTFNWFENKKMKMQKENLKRIVNFELVMKDISRTDLFLDNLEFGKKVNYLRDRLFFLRHLLV